jgi:hypothetical protein
MGFIACGDNDQCDDNYDGCARIYLEKLWVFILDGEREIRNGWNKAVP